MRIGLVYIKQAKEKAKKTEKMNKRELSAIFQDDLHLTRKNSLQYGLSKIIMLSWCQALEYTTCKTWNRPFSYSAKEPGSSVIFIHFYTRDSIEWR